MSNVSAFQVRNPFQTSVRGTILSPWADAAVMPGAHPLLTFYDDYYFLPSDLGPIPDHPDFAHRSIANHFQYCAQKPFSMTVPHKSGRKTRAVEFTPALDLQHCITQSEGEEKIDFLLIATAFDSEEKDHTLIDATLQLSDKLVRIERLSLLGQSVAPDSPRAAIQHNVDLLDTYVEQMFEAFMSGSAYNEFPALPVFTPAP